MVFQSETTGINVYVVKFIQRNPYIFVQYKTNIFL